MEDKDIFTAFIAEDEQPARDLLTDYIFKRKDLRLGGWSKNGQETFKKLTETQYDILFLDINLPLMSGIEVLEKLDSPPYVIFTTAYSEHAVKAFELGAVDYLLKPFSESRFNDAVNKAIASIRNTRGGSDSGFGLGFKEGESYYVVPYRDTYYVQSEGRVAHIHARDRDYTTSSSLKEMLKKLPPDIFVRIHKQFIVNIQHISYMQYLSGGQYVAFLKDNENTNLIVGRTYAVGLKGKLTF